MTVLCLVESASDGLGQASVRAVGLACRLAASLGTAAAAVHIGEPGAELLDGLGRFGVGELHALVASELEPYAPRAWARAIDALRHLLAAAAVLGPATDRGNELLAHLAALSDLPFVANCLHAEPAGDGALRVTRQRWAGSLLEEAVLDSAQYLLGVASTAAPPEAVAAAREPVCVRHHGEPGDDPLDVRVVETAPLAGGVDLASARIVVGGGRGVGSPENFTALERLAALLGGTVGVSRVVTSLGWRPHREQVGQTGTRITAELYLACGISGAIQHIAGCQTAKHVIAINTDPDAPIMSHADYAVVGDLNEIVPALVAALEARA